jgi:hypothetical protein
MSRSDKFEDNMKALWTYFEKKKKSTDNPDFLKYYKTHRKSSYK